MPPPLLTLTFDLEVGVGVACDLGYPCAQFRLPRYGIVGFNVPLDTIIGHFGDDFTGQ